MEVTYTCPNCGAAMGFDAASGKLHCAYCGQYMNVGEYEEKYGKKTDGGDKAGAQNEAFSGEEGSDSGQTGRGSYNKTITYQCQSCGAQLISDEHTSATICAFCGNPTLVRDRLEGRFEPDTIIPFKIDKDAAKALVRKWMAKGLLTPSMLKKDSVIDEITGVYVPFWLYDYFCDDSMLANATRTRTTSDSKYIYHHTDHYSVTRYTKAEFDRIPADASQRMPDEMMDKLEPFEYGAMVPFSMPYLSGYLSEKFNYTAQELQNRTQTRAKNYIEQMTRETIVGYATVVVIDNQVHCQKAREEYSLLPVWILNYRYRNENHQLFMNGQTGKIVADRPVSNIKTAVAGVVTFALAFAILMFVNF